jgi:hypothetical protein
MKSLVLDTRLVLGDKMHPLAQSDITPRVVKESSGNQIFAGTQWPGIGPYFPSVGWC